MLIEKISWDYLNSSFNTKRIIVFGAGTAFNTLANLMRRVGKGSIHRIAYVVDNASSKWGQKIEIEGHSVEIISPDALRAVCSKDDIIVIATQYFEDIMSQLTSYEELNDIDIIFYDDIKVCVCQHEYEAPLSFKRSDSPMIPKVLHYCWFGKGQLPSRYVEWMKSWKKYCPDYEIVEWNESNYDYKKNAYMSEAYDAGKWGFVSDYARLDIIYTYGGIYLDTDVELVRNLDELLYQPCFLGKEDCGEKCGTGLGFGAIAGFPLLACLMADYDQRHFFYSDGGLDLTVTEEIQLPRLESLGYIRANKYQIIEDAAILPSPLLGGFVGSELGMDKNIFLIHHGDGSWRTKERWDELLKNRMKKSEEKWRRNYNEEKDVPHPLQVGDEKRITGGELISPSSLKRNVECFSCGKT